MNTKPIMLLNGEALQIESRHKSALIQLYAGGRNYLEAGDRVWTRETWQVIDDEIASGSTTGSAYLVNYYAAPDMPTDRRWRVVPQRLRSFWAKRLKDDVTRPAATRVWQDASTQPRWAARLLLEVTAIRTGGLERLITSQLALAYGISPWLDWPNGIRLTTDQIIKRFIEVWDATHDRSHQFYRNPWVRVYEFKRVRDDYALEEQLAIHSD